MIRRSGAWLLVLWIALAAGAGAAAAQEAGAGGEIPPEQSVRAGEAEDQAADRSALTDPEEAALDAKAAEVAAGLRCPVCRNQSIVESNAELSREMHALVREKLAAGETPEEVEAYFVSRYGEWILLQPQARGINLLVYGLPALALVLGFFVARNRLRKWAAAGADEPGRTGGIELEAEDEQWLREALRES